MAAASIPGSVSHDRGTLFGQQDSRVQLLPHHHTVRRVGASVKPRTMLQHLVKLTHSRPRLSLVGIVYCGPPCETPTSAIVVFDNPEPGRERLSW